jgi:hypothetical protein
MAMFIPGSVRFNIDTPTWELAPDTRTLHFASPVSAGTTITLPVFEDAVHPDREPGFADLSL